MQYDTMAVTGGRNVTNVEEDTGGRDGCPALGKTCACCGKKTILPQDVEQI